MKSILAAIFLSLMATASVASTINQPGPRPNEGACVNSLCNKLTFECRSESRLEVIRSCQNNWGDDCVEYSCDKASAFACRNLDTATAIARSCADVYGSSCSRFVCDKISTFSCDDVAEVVQVNGVCQQISPRKLSCIKTTCARAGAFACDSLPKIARVSDACRGL
jgi:hypothetical protein